MGYLVFDIETIPDVEGLRRVWELAADVSDEAVVDLVSQRRRQATGSDFMPHYLQRVVAISCALRTDGTVWCWGANDFGQLGVGNADDQTMPQQVMGVAGAKGLVAGDAHTCVFDATGAVQCWGQNTDGQLGDGTMADSRLPEVGGPAYGGAASLHDRALTNLARRGDIEVEGGGGRYRLTVPDEMDLTASTHLAPARWRAAVDIPGDLAVAVPTRIHVLLCSADDADSVAALQGYATELFAQAASKPVTTQLLRLDTAGVLSVLR